MKARMMVATGLTGAAVVVAGCGSSSSAPPPAHQVGAVTVDGKRLKRLSTPGTPKGEQTVRIQVVATSAKPEREALALVPIYINGRGPFAFALDTGASKSLIAASLARELGLADRGSAGVLRGIAGSAPARKVAVGRWRAGGVGLPAATIAAMGDPKAPAGDKGPVGLLGSDVLSRYGKIAVDYNRDLLLLDPPVK